MLENTTGSVISGTHRPEDLIPAFLFQLFMRDPGSLKGFHERYWELVQHMDEEGNIDGHENDANYFLEELFDRLDGVAPEGYYFGAHMGDGSDFGFWSCEEEGF